MADLLIEAVEQNIRAALRTLYTRSACTLAEALDAVQGTYYDIFLQISGQDDRSIGYVNQDENGITGLEMRRPEGETGDSWEVVDWDVKTLLAGNTPVKYLAAGEDTLLYLAELP